MGFVDIGTGSAVLFLYSCIVKTFSILKVRAALVKSVYCVMEYTICNLVIHALEFVARCCVRHVC